MEDRFIALAPIAVALLDLYLNWLQLVVAMRGLATASAGAHFLRLTEGRTSTPPQRARLPSARLDHLETAVVLPP